MITSYTNIDAGHKGLLDYVTDFAKRMPDPGKYIIGKTMNSTQLYEEIAVLSGLRNAERLNEGAKMVYDTLTTPFKKRYYPHLYAMGVKWSDQAQFTDQYGILSRNKDWIARSHYYAKQIKIADIVNYSETSGYTGIDGVVLASASHPLADGSTYSNLSTAATFSVAALETMLTDMLGHKHYRGQPYIPVDGHNLIIPNALDIRAKRVLNSMNQPGTADNDKNVVRESVTYVGANPFLTSTTRYALIPKSENPIFMLEGKPMSTTQSFNADDQLEHRLAVWCGYETGWLLPMGTQFNAGA